MKNFGTIQKQTDSSEIRNIDFEDEINVFVTNFQHQAKHIRNATTRIKENHYAKNSLNKRQRIQTMQNKQTIIIRQR